MSQVPKRLAWTVVGTTLLLIAVATLYPSGERYAEETWACILCGDRAAADAIVNVVLFAPLGFGLGLAGVRRHRAILAGALLSSLIELAQVWVPGRDPSIGDVLSNTVGSASGVLFATTAEYWLRPTLPRARILASVWTAGAASVAWATVLLFQPSYPRSVYYGQWTPNLGHLEWYRGRVLQARVGAVPVAVGRAADSDVLRAALESRSPIVVRAIAGPPVPALGSLFSVDDDQQREVFLVGPDREDLVYRFRSRAIALRLDSPDLRVRGLLRGTEPGDSLNVVVSREGGDLCLSANARHVCGLWPGASAGWSLLFFGRHFPTWLVTLLNAAWLAALAAPVGYWSSEKRTLAMLGGILVVAILGTSALGATLGLPDAVFMIAGMWLGALVRTILRAPSQVTQHHPN